MGRRFNVEPPPSQPSLEYQQKLAKRLLREVWAADAQAIDRLQSFLPHKTAPESVKRGRATSRPDHPANRQ